MTNIAFFSDNKDFVSDLIAQIEKYAPEFKFCSDYDEDSTLDIAIIDDNIETYKEIRGNYHNIPLIYLFSNESVVNENGLNIALKKPFSLNHFFDILRSANNKLDNSSAGYLNFGVYELRPFEKEIENRDNGKIIKLTEKEVDIIKYLYKRRNYYISKSELQKKVWKYSEDVSTHTVETHIYRLRRKVETSEVSPLILTNKGGYKLNLES